MLLNNDIVLKITQIQSCTVSEVFQKFGNWLKDKPACNMPIERQLTLYYQFLTRTTSNMEAHNEYCAQYLAENHNY